MRKSICFISPFAGPLFLNNASHGVGGAERQLYLFGQMLTKRGWAVSFIVRRVSDGPLSKDGIKVVQIPYVSLGRGYLLPLDILAVFRHVMKLSPDYIAIKNAPQFLCGAIIAGFFKKAKTIVWGQTASSFDKCIKGEPLIVRWLRHLAIRKSICICQTVYQLERLEQFFAIRGTIVRNVTVPLETPLRIADRFAINSPYYFWCGNSLAKKRGMILIELAKLMPKMNFVVAMNVGDRAIYDKVWEEASKLSNVKFLGSVPFEEIDPLFANAKLLIHTATIEGFPNTYLQALQYGKPVISVNINPDGILSEQGLGKCLFDDDSHLAMSNTELAHKLKIAIHEIESKYFDYAERCRRYIALNHLSDICTDKFIEALEMS